MRTQASPARDAGFTMIELLVTMGLTCILLSAGVAGFRTLLSSTRVAGLENEFVSALGFARSEAIRRGRSVGIAAVNASSSSNEWGPGLRVWLDVNGDGVYSATNDTTLRVGQATAGGSAKLDSVAGVSTLRFTGAGFVAGFVPDVAGGTTSSFKVCDGKAGRLITVRATGQVTSDVLACS